MCYLVSGKGLQRSSHPARHKGHSPYKWYEIKVTRLNTLDIFTVSFYCTSVHGDCIMRPHDVCISVETTTLLKGECTLLDVLQYKRELKIYKRKKLFCMLVEVVSLQ